MEQEFQMQSSSTLPYGFELGEEEVQAINALSPKSMRTPCYFFRLDELMHDGTRPQREAFLNFLAAINEPGFNFVYIIRGDKSGTHIYLGVTAHLDTMEAQRIGDFAADVLYPSFQGMFRGSKLTKLLETDFYSEILQSARQMKCTGMMLGIPSLKEEREHKDDETDFQGIDRLASAMHGEIWQMVIVCEPLRRNDIAVMREKIYKMYEELTLLAKTSVQGQHSSGKNFGHNEGRSTTVNDSSSSGSSHTVTHGENESISYTEGKNKSQSQNSGESVSFSHTQGQSKNDNRSQSRTETQGGSDSRAKGHSAGETHTHKNSSDNSSETHGTSHSSSTGISESHSIGESTSETQSKNRTSGITDTVGHSSSSQKGRGTSDSTAEGKNKGYSHSEGLTESYGSTTGESTGKSLTATFEFIHKKEAEELKYIDEILLPRLQNGESRGMFKTAVFLYAQNPSILGRLQSNIRGIFQNGQCNFSPLVIERLTDGSQWMDDFQIHSIFAPQKASQSVFYSVPSRDGYLELASCLTLSEVGLIAGLPQCEVPGLSLTPYTPFGLNTGAQPKEGFTLGKMIYGGQALANNPVQLDRDVLNKHVG